MEDLDIEISKLEAFAIGKVVDELAAVALQVGGVEHLGEELCIPTQYSDRREELERTLTPLTNPRTAWRTHEPA